MKRRSFLARSLGGVLFFPAVHLSGKILSPVMPEPTVSMKAKDLRALLWPDQHGMREDLMNVIYQLDKQDHPLMTNLGHKPRVYHGWVT